MEKIRIWIPNPHVEYYLKVKTICIANLKIQLEHRILRFRYQILIFVEISCAASEQHFFVKNRYRLEFKGSQVLTTNSAREKNQPVKTMRFLNLKTNFHIVKKKKKKLSWEREYKLRTNWAIKQLFHVQSFHNVPLKNEKRQKMSFRGT